MLDGEGVVLVCVLVPALPPDRVPEPEPPPEPPARPEGERCGLVLAGVVVVRGGVVLFLVVGVASLLRV